MKKLMVAVVSFAGLVVSASAVLVHDMYNWADPRYFTTGCKFASVLDSGKASIGIWVKNITRYADRDNEAANMFGNLHGNVDSQYASGGLMLSIRGGSFRFEVEGKTSTDAWARRYLTYAGASEALMTDGGWHFLLGTCDVAAQTARFFIDGQLVDENTELDLVTVPSGRCFAAGGIGEKTESADLKREDYVAGHNGLFAEATIWKKALTAAQAADLYTRRALVWESGLVGYWPLAENGNDCASSPARREDGSVPHALINYEKTVDDPDFFPVSPLEGPINVYRLEAGGTETYLGGYTLMSAAVAAAEEDVGSSYKILVMGDGSGTPAAYTEEFQEWQGFKTKVNDGTHILCEKSYHFVGEGTPDHLDASTYPAILSNCVFEVKGTNCDYSFENLRLEGKSRIAPGTNPRSLSVGNCYANVSNEFNYVDYDNTWTRNAFIIAPGRGKNAFSSAVMVTNNTIICKRVSFASAGTSRWLCEIIAPEIIVSGNVFGSPNLDERCIYVVFYSQYTCQNSEIYITNNIAYFDTDSHYGYWGALVNGVDNDVDGGNAASMVIADNFVMNYRYDENSLLPDNVKSEFDVGYVNSVHKTVELSGNRLNGFCYNNFSGKAVKTVQTGHDVGDNIQTMPAGMVVLHDMHNGKCADGTTLDAAHCCTNCCVLGYRVTLDANGGTWPGGVDPDAVTNQTFEALFRGQQLSPNPDHVVLGDEQMPWKNEKQAEGWKDGATGTVYTREQLVGSKVTDSKSYTAVYYKGLILFFGPAN